MPWPGPGVPEASGLEDAPGSSCLLFLILAPAVALTTSSIIVEPGVSHTPLQRCLMGVTRQT